EEDTQMPTPKTGSTEGGNGTGKEVTLFDLDRFLVTIGGTTFPTRAFTARAALRFAQQYPGQIVPLSDVAEAFASDVDDEEQRTHWLITRLNAIAKEQLGKDEQIVFVNAYGVTGRG